MRKINLTLLKRDLLESISGTDQDFTTGSIPRAVLLLSIPMVLEMLMESVFAIADIFFISRLGADMVAVVGITESLMTIVYSLGMGLSVGTTALISRRTGEKRPQTASLTAVQAILAGIFISMIIAIPGALYSSDILRLMGANDAIIHRGNVYTGIMLGSNTIIMLLFIINAVFRSAGDAAVSMRVLWLANLVNIILDPCLIFGLGPFPEMGIMGAAIATATGRGLAVIYQFHLLFHGKTRISLCIKNLVLRIRILLKLVRLSLGGIGQSLIATTSWIGLVRIVAEFGSEVLAGYTIAIRIIVFSLLPAWGLSNATATLVGQNLGAKQPERARRSVWITGRINMIFLGIFALMFISEPSFFIELFIKDSRVIETGSVCLRIISYGFVLYALGMVMIQAFNGAGDTATPVWINLFCFWILEIPLAYLLSINAGFGEQGVYIAIIASESIMALAAMALFMRGKWQFREV